MKLQELPEDLQKKMSEYLLITPYINLNFMINRQRIDYKEIKNAVIASPKLFSFLPKCPCRWVYPDITRFETKWKNYTWMDYNTGFFCKMHKNTMGPALAIIYEAHKSGRNHTVNPEGIDLKDAFYSLIRGLPYTANLTDNHKMIYGLSF